MMLPRSSLLPYPWVDVGRALLDFVFPRTCAGCELALLPEEAHLCPNCLAQLPRTGMGSFPLQNDIARRFAGHVPLIAAASGYFFEPNSRLQQIIHALKYHYRPSLGVFLGQMVAYELGDAFTEPNPVLVPVPLHPRRHRARGYNQSERLATGIARRWKGVVRTDLVRRIRYTDSQTGKGRLQRFSNMELVFQAIPTVPRCVWVIDDVVTTGATILGVLKALHTAGAEQLGVITLAVAN